MISTIQGINLAYYRAAGAIAVQDQISVNEAQQRMLNRVASEVGPGPGRVGAGGNPNGIPGDLPAFLG
jgi:hypothetical protein